MTFECLECGSNKAPAKAGARFCCTACRMDWNNRRMKRGAELYDLLMAHNYERKAARPMKLWAMIFRLMSAYRDADRAKRNGRQSWRPVKEAVAEIPMAFGRDGDKR